MSMKTEQPKPLAKEGLTRAKPAASHLGIGVSSWWLYVKQGRIRKPLKLTERTSVWDCEYVRGLARTGLPPAGTEHADETKQAEQVA